MVTFSRLEHRGNRGNPLHYPKVVVRLPLCHQYARFDSRRERFGSSRVQFGSFRTWLATCRVVAFVQLQSRLLSWQA